MKRVIIDSFAALVLFSGAAFAQPGSTNPVIPGGGGAGVSGLSSCSDGTALADNALMRADGTTGCQGSTVTLADSTGNLQWEGTTADGFEGNFTIADPTADWTWAWGADGTLTGATQFNLENLRLDGNALTTITPAATTGATAAGQSLSITASPAVASTDTDGAASGGAINITSGASARRNSGDAQGGAINLTTGVGTSGHYSGAIVLQTSDGPVGGGNIYFNVDGAGAWLISGLTSTFSSANTNDGSVAMLQGNSSATSPVYVFYGDQDTGIGRAAANQLSLISGGAEVFRVVSGGIRFAPSANPPVTCGDANTLGYEYTDTSLAKCFCDGTAWQVLNPLTAGVGTCS